MQLTELILTEVRKIYNSIQNNHLYITQNKKQSVVVLLVCVEFSDLVFRESQDIGQFLAPAHLIQKRFITGILTGVAVQPTMLTHRENLCPHMI